MKKNIRTITFFAFAISLGILIWVNQYKRVDDVVSKTIKKEKVAIQKFDEEELKMKLKEENDDNDKKAHSKVQWPQYTDISKLHKEYPYVVVDQLNDLLEKGDKIPNKNYFFKVDSLYMKIKQGLEEGSLDIEELELQVNEWFRAGDERSVTAAIVVAAQIGNNDMVRVIKEFYEESDDPDMKLFIERQLNNMRFDRNENISDLLEFIESEKYQKFTSALTYGLARYANPEVIDWLVSNYQNANNDENRDYWIKRIEHISNQDSFNYLINVIKKINNSEISQAGLNALGSSDGNDGMKLLFTLASDNSIEFSPNQIGEAISHYSNESNWNLIKDELIFGTDENKRIVAAKAIFARNSYYDKNFVNKTFGKLLEEDIPEALRKELTNLIQKTEGG